MSRKQSPAAVKLLRQAAKSIEEGYESKYQGDSESAHAFVTVAGKRIDAALSVLRADGLLQ